MSEEEKIQMIRDGVNTIDRWWIEQGEKTVTCEERERLEILEMPLMD